MFRYLYALFLILGSWSFSVLIVEWERWEGFVLMIKLRFFFCCVLYLIEFLNLFLVLCLGWNLIGLLMWWIFMFSVGMRVWLRFLVELSTKIWFSLLGCSLFMVLYLLLIYILLLIFFVYICRIWGISLSYEHKPD